MRSRNWRETTCSHMHIHMPYNMSTPIHASSISNITYNIVSFVIPSAFIDIHFSTCHACSHICLLYHHLHYITFHSFIYMLISSFHSTHHQAFKRSFITLNHEHTQMLCYFQKPFPCLLLYINMLSYIHTFPLYFFIFLDVSFI